MELNRCKEDEWPFKRNEFVNRYRGYRMRSATPQYPKQLIGIAEADNARHGRPIPQPILIGNQEQARRVLEGGSDMPALTFRPLSEYYHGLHIRLGYSATHTSSRAKISRSHHAVFCARQ